MITDVLEIITIIYNLFPFKSVIMSSQEGEQYEQYYFVNGVKVYTSILEKYKNVKIPSIKPFREITNTEYEKEESSEKESEHDLQFHMD